MAIVRLFHIKMSNPVSFYLALCIHSWASPIAQLVKNPSAMQETLVQFLGREDLLENG